MLRFERAEASVEGFTFMHPGAHLLARSSSSPQLRAAGVHRLLLRPQFLQLRGGAGRGQRLRRRRKGRLTLSLVGLPAPVQLGPVDCDLRAVGGIEADRHYRPDALHPGVLRVKPVLELTQRAILERDPNLDVVGAGSVDEDLAVVGLDQDTVELRAVAQELLIAEHGRESSPASKGRANASGLIVCARGNRI